MRNCAPSKLRHAALGIEYLAPAAGYGRRVYAARPVLEIGFAWALPLPKFAARRPTPTSASKWSRCVGNLSADRRARRAIARDSARCGGSGRHYASRRSRWMVFTCISLIRGRKASPQTPLGAAGFCRKNRLAAENRCLYPHGHRLGRIRPAKCWKYCRKTRSCAIRQKTTPRARISVR